MKESWMGNLHLFVVNGKRKSGEQWLRVVLRLGIHLFHQNQTLGNEALRDHQNRFL